MSDPLVIGVDGDAALAWGLAAALRREGRAPPVLLPTGGAAGPATSRAAIDVVPLAPPRREQLRRAHPLLSGAAAIFYLLLSAAFFFLLPQLFGSRLRLFVAPGIRPGLFRFLDLLLQSR